MIENEISVHGKEEEIEPVREIGELRSAIAGVQAKIDWHESEIKELQEKINQHRDQQTKLNEILMKEVGDLISIKKHVRTRTKRKENGARAGSTRFLIKQFLSESGEAQNTESIKTHLKKEGKLANPSVELSRMLKSGEVVRPRRGFYEMPKK